MIGIWSSYLHIYLYAVGIAMLIGFGVPLLLVPNRWARVFRWQIPQEKDLATFMGRSLGVFIIVIAVFAIRAAGMPAVQPFFFDMILWTVSGSILIHAYGAITKTQPITETIEIAMWVLILLATLAFYPA